MIREAVLMAALAWIGMAMTLPLIDHVELRWTHIAAAFPIGAAAYVAVAAAGIIVAGRVSPPATVGITAIGAVAIGTFAWSRRSHQRLVGELVRRLVIVTGIVVVMVAAVRLVHVARVTPDSIRYLVTADTLAESIDAVSGSDLIKRHFVYPALQALATSTDRLYLASMSPLFGLAGGLLAADLVQREMAAAGLPGRRRLALIAAMGLFVATTNRLLYDAFYLNSHMVIATCVLLAVVAIRLRDRAPALMSGAALAMVVVTLARPEGFLLAIGLAIALLSVESSSRRLLAAVTAPAVGCAVYYAVVLAPRVPGTLDRLTSPVAGTMLALVCLAGLGAAAALLPRVGEIVRRHILETAIAGVGLLTTVFVVGGPEILIQSAGATAVNLVRSGGWGLAWPMLVLGLVVAARARVVPEQRTLTAPLWVFAAGFPLLPYLRDGAFRVGTGDSGNRTLAHVAFVAVVYVVLSIGYSQVRDRAPEQRTRPSPPG